MANRSPQYDPKGFPFTFISWNVKSLNQPVTHNKVFTYLRKSNMETHLQTSDNAGIKGDWVGQACLSVYNCKARGTGILIIKTFCLLHQMWKQVLMANLLLL